MIGLNIHKVSSLWMNFPTTDFPYRGCLVYLLVSDFMGDTGVVVTVVTRVTGDGSVWCCSRHHVLACGQGWWQAGKSPFISAFITQNTILPSITPFARTFMTLFTTPCNFITPLVTPFTTPFTHHSLHHLQLYSICITIIYTILRINYTIHKLITPFIN